MKVRKLSGAARCIERVAEQSAHEGRCAIGSAETRVLTYRVPTAAEPGLPSGLDPLFWD